MKIHETYMNHIAFAAIIGQRRKYIVQKMEMK